jgi:serine phosphatase RsbU (regulator of sigma subunit)/Tfp pilus assembly protein PilF
LDPNFEKQVELRIKISFFLSLIISAQLAIAQHNPNSHIDKHYSDSLEEVVNSKNADDTARVKALNELGRTYMDADPVKAFNYAKQAEKIAMKLNRKKSLAQAYFIIGYCYDGLQEYNSALEYFYKALPLREEEGNKASLIRIYNHIGIIYAYQKDYQNALKYFLKFSEVVKQIHDTLLEGNMYNNIGVIYKNLGKRNIASEYFYKALKIFQAKKVDKGIASCYTNIATLLELDLDYTGSVEYNMKALALFRGMKDEFGMTTSFINTAESYSLMNKDALAQVYYDSAKVFAERSHDKLHLRDLYDGMYKLYAKQKDYKLAFEYLQKFMNVRDSSFSADAASKAAALESKYKMEQSEKEIELYRQKEEIGKLRETQKSYWIGLLIAIVLSVIVVAGFLWYRYNQKRHQNDLLKHHNIAIQHSKKEITDSINYAKRIQMSILPPDALVDRLLPDSFVLYKPKDIVSGDFYWVEECEGKVLFAAVDCTGHGVPGAMMSVLGFNLLSQAVNEKKLTQPAQILEHLDYGVDKMLRQSTDQNSVRDGMDLSLCCIDYEKGILQFAGAYNGLWMVKHKNKEFVELKADKMMIGVNAGAGADHFTNHEIKLEKGDTVYIFSDGYADQFGGPQGKKFKYKPMKELLVEIHDLPMAEQRAKLDKTIERWRGALEQVDDILVIGVRY